LNRRAAQASRGVVGEIYVRNNTFANET